MNPYVAYAQAMALQYGVPWQLFYNQIMNESGFDPGAYNSTSGATGIAQIIPTTAAGWGVNPSDPYASLEAAAKAMAGYFQSYGNWQDALVAYNAGPRWAGTPYANLPTETQNYITRILGSGATAAPSSTSAAAAAAAGVPTSYDPFVGSATTTAAAGSFPSTTTGGAPWLQAIGKIPIVGPAIEQEVSASVVGGFAIILGIIGGIWLIYSSKTAQSVIVNTGKTVAKGATMAAEGAAAIAA